MERLNNLPKFMGLASGKAEVQTHSSCSLALALLDS